MNEKPQHHAFLPLIIGFIFLSVLVSSLTTIAIININPDFLSDYVVKKAEQQINLEAPRTVTIYNDTEEAVKEVVKEVKPAVASIIIMKEQAEIESFDELFDFDSPFDFFFFDEKPGKEKKETSSSKEKVKVGGGTGFFITADGLLLTNKHVVNDEDAEYTVVADDGVEYKAEVKARDPFFDFAILQVDGENFPTVKLGNSDDLEVGQTVLAIGNALAEFDGTVTKGILSAEGRTTIVGGSNGELERLEGALQTDASINPGNSGGPLIDLAGHAIGINTAIANSAEGIGFVIPINDVKIAVNTFLEKGRIVRPQIGLRYRLITESLAEKNNLDVTEGALVVRGNDIDSLAVIPGGPADKAGIEENDIILEVNGEKIDENNSLTRLIQKNAVNDTITMKIIHDGEEKEVEVLLEESRNRS